MSAIDCIDHAAVASYFGIPVYWVMQESIKGMVNDTNDDNPLNQYNLVVGGGSGEHDALILDNDELVAWYLSRLWQYFEDESKFNLTEGELQTIQLFAEQDHDYHFDQNDWPLETYANIYNKIDKSIASYQCLHTRILSTFALFIIHVLPIEHSLQDYKLRELVELYKDKFLNVDDRAGEQFKLLNDLRAYFPGHHFGRRTVNGKVEWRFGLQDAIDYLNW
jgi:hypothetical protein